MNQYSDSNAKATEDNNLTYIRGDLIENYPDYKQNFYKKCNHNFTMSNIEKIG